MLCLVKSMTARDAVVVFSAAMWRSLRGKLWGVASRFECPFSRLEDAPNAISGLRNAVGGSDTI